MNEMAVKSRYKYFLVGSALFLIFARLIKFGTCRQVSCNRQAPREWHLEPQNVQVRWTLKESTYCSPEKCQVTQGAAKNFLQICPLLLQFGDKLLVSSDEALESYGINLLNASQEDFESCSTLNDPKDQLLFTKDLKGSRMVDLKWLSPGVHYFTAFHEGSSQLCKMGLRLNVTVKDHLCRRDPFMELCSGNGICQTQNWDNVYRCKCREHYYGNFCESFDSCCSNPCANGTVCISYGSVSPHRPAYECFSPSQFTGKPSGSASGIFFAGPSCEEGEAACESAMCRNSSICSAGSPGGACAGPEGSISLNCTTKLNNSGTLHGCRHEHECVPDNNVSTPPHASNFASEELINIKCFSGKNCEEIIDYCRLLGINCLNEGLCLSIIGGYNCLCAPGWTGEFCQHVENACLIFPDSCINGATCIERTQLGAPPQYACACPHGYTGVHCELEVNECDSNPCHHDGICSDFVGHYKCTCPIGENCEVDIDACKFANSTCAPGTLCVDLSDGMVYTCRAPCPHHIQPCNNGGRCFLSDDDGTYSCVCSPGWTGPNCLENIDDCEGHWCQNEGTCVDKISDYRCLCRHGYTGAFCEQDVDNCIENLCSKHGTCLNQHDNYTCHCMLGYEGRYCELEADECRSSPCSNGAMCVDFVGGYACHCPAGFEGRTCSEQVNACWSNPGLNGSMSVDFINNYTCRCLPAFAGLFCEVDFDRCNSGPCQNGTICFNGMEEYQRFCPHGTLFLYKAQFVFICNDNISVVAKKVKGIVVVEFSFCPTGLMEQFCEVNADNCLNSPCGPLSVCKNSLNAYDCFCAPGFIGNNCEIEVNECLSQPCQNGGSCFDELNAFSCLCPEGIEGNSCEINIDECHSSPCLHHGTCTDLVNGYECICLLGFSGVTCELDINECTSSPCKNGATCVDQPGNYSCQCLAPFKGPNCEFLPCEASNPCENGASCVEESNHAHFPLGFRCNCPHGFLGPRCETNVDECQSSPCLHGFCYDVVDGFYCLCKPGYAGLHCEQDVDDCVTNKCENNSSCKDLHLGYQCLCETGWEGEYCQRETDECKSLPCRNNGTCTDLLAGFKCTCQPGWTGPDCSTKVNECDSKPCLNGASCVESAVLGQFTCSCPLFYTGTLCQQRYDPCGIPHNPCLRNSTCLLDARGRVTCRCQPGFVGTHCEIDTDECSSSPCRNQGYCLDGVNNYRCECRDGFLGLRCEEEINECSSSPCLNGAVCQDLVNHFRCHCPPGYFGTLCNLDVNECEDLPCLHSGTCVNKHGGFECKCFPGFSGKPHFHLVTNRKSMREVIIYHACVVCCTMSYNFVCNLQECASVPCLNGASCADLINKYACFCREGYTGKSCETDINVCLELPQNFTCFNGGSCVDGPGSNFTCRCPAGFVGLFCEVEVNECCSEPCLNGAICNDLVNGYHCYCPPGWTGLHCEDDINECLPQPCEQGMCIQNNPGHGYTCFCRPGFVGKNCEQNYNDCLMQTCPPQHYCVDGINEVSCVPIMTSDQSMPAIPQAPPSSLWPLENIKNSPDFSYVSYSGDSFLEFEGIDLDELTTISVRFQTQVPEGMLLFVSKGLITDGSFFIKLFIQDGALQYAFSCNSEEGVRTINTNIPVDDGHEHTVYIRQYMAPCDAELEVPGYEKLKSVPSNYWSVFTLQKTGHLFVGGLPLNYPINEDSTPFNYTGCIEITEINKMNRFYVFGAIGGGNVNNCSQPPVTPPTLVTSGSTKPLTKTGSACNNMPCHNGGTCRPLWLASGAASFLCDCPLHFGGRLCEQDTPVFFPSFNGNSYLELPSLTSILKSSDEVQNPSSENGEDTVTLYLTLKTRASHGTILYMQEKNFAGRFLHVFLKDGRPVVKLRCSGNHILTEEASPKISNDRLTPITVRYTLPSGGLGGVCTAEVGVNNRTENLQQSSHSQALFGPIFLGDVPSRAEVQDDVGLMTGLVGCIRELQVNNRELHIMKEAIRGRNIRNCGGPVCQHQPCRNGGTCVSNSENWFCLCPTMYSGKLCQLSTCDRNPCLHGATCVPSSSHHVTCLCPFGRAGLLCEEYINITRPQFSGNDEFGYTSFLAFSSIPSMSAFYEFKLQLTFTNNGSALKDNLILFTGQKGQGMNGDDFLVLGVRNGRIVHRFNLGSGVGTVVSGPLNRRLGIHTIQFGRSLRTGWLKVDDQKNKTGSSPGLLVSLNIAGHLYVGGYSEHVPQLLPAGARFRNGFQGCIFDLQFRTRQTVRFHAPGRLEGQPSSGRSVGQCGDNPCSLVHCKNGRTCVQMAAAVYCRCPLGWKVELCTDTLSPCDAQHMPPPLCAWGSTCVPSPDGYRCQCPLGTGGRYCQQGLTLSDPFFNSSRSSWMSFQPVGVRHRTNVKMEFKTLSQQGLLFYIAQHLSPQAGDFFSMSLTAGFVQLCYNLGDRTVTLQSVKQVDTHGGTWHTVQAGRNGRQGYLVLDGKEVKVDFEEGMTALDVGTEIFVGGTPNLNAISNSAVEDEPTGFTGCIREVIVNGGELQLTEKGASGGANIEDCDGTSCGYKVCKNGGQCSPVGAEAFTCVCLPLWTGPSCDQSVYCVNNLCMHGSTCIPNVTAASYTCACTLGWEGRHCDEITSAATVTFEGHSYVRYIDPKYQVRNLTYTVVSFNFTSHSSDGLILWLGKAQDEDDDYLAVGLHDSHLKIGVNLGERVSTPFLVRNTTVCCNRWKSVSVIHNRTVIQVFVDGDRVLFEDVDPYETHVAMNYGGVYYLGGFELHRQVWEVTQGLFSKGFVGKVKDFHIYGEKVYS
ncbi:protein eyes shut homolog [Arapaima gigas]